MLLRAIIVLLGLAYMGFVSHQAFNYFWPKCSKCGNRYRRSLLPPRTAAAFECKGCEIARTMATSYIVTRPKAKARTRAKAPTKTPAKPKTVRKPRKKTTKAGTSTAKGEFDPFDL